MSERDPLARLLGAPDEDAGCEGGFALLAEYVEAELAGRGPQGPGRARPRPQQRFLTDRVSGALAVHARA